MLPAFVINLDRRADRMNAFWSRNGNLSEFLSIDRFPAVDGKAITIDNALKARIHPWNLENLPPDKLRGVIGCALSHISLFEHIGRIDCSAALVFEDDARLIHGNYASHLKRLVSNLPAIVGFLWLSPQHRLRKLRRVKQNIASRLYRYSEPRLLPWTADHHRTTEAYMIRPQFARVLHDHLFSNIGAIDEHIRAYARSRPQGFYCTAVPFFTQADRRDTDIQHNAVNLTAS